MRQNVAEVIESYKAHRPRSSGPISTDGNTIFSYMTRIAWRREDGKTTIIDPKSSKITSSKTTSLQVGSLRIAFGKSCTHEECAKDEEHWKLCPENKNLIIT